MNLYTPQQLADSMRVVRRNTIAIAQDIPEAQYDYRPAPDSRSVRETFLHIASMMLFDLQIHEKQRVASMEGFDFQGFMSQLPTYEKRPVPKDAILESLREVGERWCNWVETLPGERAAERVRPRADAAAPGKSRFEMLIGTKEHEMHHRGQLMVVERLLGIVPHLTRNRRRPEPAQKTTGPSAA